MCCIIALDASISMYQLRTGAPEIRNRNGENISDIMGFFYRTVHLLENKIKPVYVFDGRPPEMKLQLLDRRAEAAGNLRKTDKGDINPEKRLSSRYTENCQKILQLLGVPYIEAKSEAEATCAALVKCGKASYAATEDMDALPFGCSSLLRNLRAEKNGVVKEYSLPEVLKQLNLTHKQFVDVCILLGCDYCGKIHGLGPKRVLKLMQEHKSIEEIEKHIDQKVHPLPHNWQYHEARQLFHNPSVTIINDHELQWTEPDEEGLVKFLSYEKYVKEGRVRSRLEKLRKALQPAELATPTGAGIKRQARMDDFFPVKKAAATAETEVEKEASGNSNKKGKRKKRQK
ncbi:flap endonuclease 1-like isoform X2 [Protopterus annectens]|uniref:flap endonuclease 1-like isoform X2 n=1 Tax=Protopterus annectens TaxID=7888 RepID=UPI001CFA053F|nr:flap endonuclease 1-like isoform X2 [Protopterus annectens]